MWLVVYLPTLLLVLSYSLYYYFTRKYNYWKERNVAGPKPIFFFGNLKESTLRRIHPSYLFNKIYNDFSDQKVVGFYRLVSPALLIRDLDIVKHVLIKDFDMFVDRGLQSNNENLGSNLFSADGETWRVLRSQFTPIFTSGKLKNMLYLMVERGDKFMEYVDNLIQKRSEQEIHSLLQKYTLSTISACAFGLDIDINSDQMKFLISIDNMIFKTSYVNEIDMLYPGILKKLNLGFLPAKVNAFFHNLVEKVISQRNGKPSNRKDFMDLILELREKGEVFGKKYENDKQLIVKLTDGIIAAQAFVFFAAGYETSATTMTYMLYKLAQNPDIQEKVISEIDEILKKYNGPLTYDVLQECTYLNKVFDETLRMYPIVDALQRNAQADYKIPGTEVQIEKGQLIFIPVTAIHHDEKYYPEPEKFDPERFSTENVRNRHPCAYLPFGLGPRTCIGMRFAQVQAHVCMVKILSKYRVEPSSKTQKFITFDPLRILISPQSGLHLNIIPRK